MKMFRFHTNENIYRTYDIRATTKEEARDIFDGPNRPKPHESTNGEYEEDEEDSAGHGDPDDGWDDDDDDDDSE